MNESIVLHYYFFFKVELLSHMKVPGSKASSDSHSNNNKKPTCTEACINLYALNWMYLKVKKKEKKKEPLTFSALCTEFPLKFLLIITLLYWMWYCLWHITWFSLLTFLLIVRIETANPKTGLNFEIWQNRGFFHILNVRASYYHWTKLLMHELVKITTPGLIGKAFFYYYCRVFYLTI